MQSMTTNENPWPPIPDHAIDVGGRPMLPERLIDVEGKPYVRCYLHGLIPADHRCDQSPGDHFCGVAAHPNHVEGEDHDDQACSHAEWSATQSDKLHIIANLHQQGTEEGGIVTGFCTECSWQYPCPTVHVANGWGEIHDCENVGWCQHAGVPLTCPD